MSGWLLLFVAIIYFLVSVDLFMKGNIALSVVFIAYGVSNIGLYFVT